VARCVCGSDKIGDLHTKSAIVFYGPDFQKREDGKQLRQNSKVANFALLYAGGGRAVQAAIGCDENEGRRIKNLFDNQYKDINAWWAETRKAAKSHGFVRTMFGRMYPLPDMNSPEKGFRAKAERNAVNSPIQGTCADMIKLAMGEIYRETKERGWMDKLEMIITMHDELVFEIEGSILTEAINLIVGCMTRNKILAKKVPASMRVVPYTSDIELGPNWMVPWDLKAITNREVRFKGDKTIKDPKKAKEMGLDWESLSLVPQSLQPFLKVTPGV
jgi:DNA polymerase-1